jgi:hypothetical protein
MTETPPVTCALCQRPLDDKITRHHLYPRKEDLQEGICDKTEQAG